MVNQRLQKLYNENIQLRKIRNLLIRDLKDVSNKLDNFLDSFGNALLKKQREIERLKEAQAHARGQ